MKRVMRCLLANEINVDFHAIRAVVLVLTIPFLVLISVVCQGEIRDLATHEDWRSYSSFAESEPHHFAATTESSFPEFIDATFVLARTVEECQLQVPILRIGTESLPMENQAEMIVLLWMMEAFEADVVWTHGYAQVNGNSAHATKFEMLLRDGSFLEMDLEQPSRSVIYHLVEIEGQAEFYIELAQGTSIELRIPGNGTSDSEEVTESEDEPAKETTIVIRFGDKATPDINAVFSLSGATAAMQRTQALCNSYTGNTESNALH